MSTNLDSYGATRGTAGEDATTEDLHATPGATSKEDELKAPIFDRVGDILGDTSKESSPDLPLFL